MIRICYKDLGKVGFQKTFAKLMQSPMKDKAAFSLVTLNRAIVATSAKMNEEFRTEFMAKFMVPGFNMQAQETTGVSKELALPFQCNPGMEEACKVALDAFGERFMEVRVSKFTGDFLFSVGAWSPAELEALEPISSSLNAV